MPLTKKYNGKTYKKYKTYKTKAEATRVAKRLKVKPFGYYGARVHRYKNRYNKIVYIVYVNNSSKKQFPKYKG
tara:strand:- start:1883 stop:2101 length:219 start_codon:yes stop_codon:yes gene_type:complete